MSEVRSGQLRVVTKLSCIGDGVSNLDENKEFFMVGVGTPYLVLDRVVGPTGINTSWRILLRGKVTSWREADILCDTLLEDGKTRMFNNDDVDVVVQSDENGYDQNIRKF